MRGRPWHALQAQAFSMAQVMGPDGGASGVGMRENAYRVFAGCPNLVMDLQTDAVLGVFQRGLLDNFSIEVCAYTVIKHQLIKRIGSTRCSPRLCGLPHSSGLDSALAIPASDVSHSRDPAFSFTGSLAAPTRECYLISHVTIVTQFIQLTASLDLPNDAYTTFHIPTRVIRASPACPPHVPPRSYPSPGRLWPHADRSTPLPNRQR